MNCWKTAETVYSITALLYIIKVDIPEILFFHPVVECLGDPVKFFVFHDIFKTGFLPFSIVDKAVEIDLPVFIFPFVI